MARLDVRLNRGRISSVLVKLTAGTPGENATVSAWKGGAVHTQSIVADDRREGAAIFN